LKTAPTLHSPSNDFPQGSLLKQCFRITPRIDPIFKVCKCPQVNSRHAVADLQGRLEAVSFIGAI